MIKIEKVSVYGLEEAIRGMRNPMNSWNYSDSYHNKEEYDSLNRQKYGGADNVDYCVGYNDSKLMASLAAGGPVHAKYRRMIVVYLDITAPLYWWKEFDTYKVGTVANSGPLPNEITWDVVTQESGSKTRLFERTTVTNRIRRVARFDSEVISDAIIANRPNVIVLNHVDYFDMKQHRKKTLSKRQLNAISSIEKAIGSRIDYVGNGPDNIISL